MYDTVLEKLITKSLLVSSFLYLHPWKNAKDDAVWCKTVFLHTQGDTLSSLSSKLHIRLMDQLKNDASLRSSVRSLQGCLRLRFEDMVFSYCSSALDKSSVLAFSFDLLLPSLLIFFRHKECHFKVVKRWPKDTIWSCFLTEFLGVLYVVIFHTVCQCQEDKDLNKNSKKKPKTKEIQYIRKKKIWMPEEGLLMTNH